MIKPGESCDSAGYNRSPPVAENPYSDAKTKTMMDKIDGGCFSYCVVLLGIILVKMDWCFDIISGVQLYYKADYWYCGLTLSFALIPSFINMLLSQLFYSMNDVKKLNGLGGFFRFTCHTIFFPFACIITRLIDRGRIGRKCQSEKRDLLNCRPEIEATRVSVEPIKSSIDLLKEHFEQLKSEDSSLALMFHLENVFEAGFQLLLKVFILTHDKSFSENVTDWWMMVWGIVIGIGSCAYRIGCTRKNRNLVDDNQKSMSEEHFWLLVLAHLIQIGGWFTFLGLILDSVSSLTFICSCLAYVVIVLAILLCCWYLSVYDTLFWWDNNWGSSWDKVKNWLALLATSVSGLFLFPDYRLKYQDLHDLVYLKVPLFTALISCVLIFTQTISMKSVVMYVSTLILFGVSWKVFKMCDKFSLDPEDDFRRKVCILTALISFKEFVINMLQKFLRYLYSCCSAPLLNQPNQQQGAISGQKDDVPLIEGLNKEAIPISQFHDNEGLDLQEQPAPAQLGSSENRKREETYASNRHLPTKMDTDVIGLVDCYPNVPTKPRGLALILNFMKFDNETYDLTLISEKNASDLNCLLTNLDYEVRICPNLSKDEVWLELDKFTCEDLHDSADSTVVVIMSHGDIGSRGEGSLIYTRDGRYISSEDVLQRFNNVNCPHLKGKPKMFIFDFSRGGKHDEGIRNPSEIPFQTSNSPNNEPEMVIKNRRLGRISEIPDIKTAMASTTMKVERTIEDMLITYATLPGYHSFSQPSTGAGFINNLYLTFMKHAHEYHVERLLKKVDTEMKLMPAGMVQTLEIVNRGFNRKFYFNPGLERLPKLKI